MQPASCHASNSARIQICRPRNFGPGGLCLVSVFGLLLVLPVVLSVVVLSLAGPGVWPLALPFLALGITTFFLPFGLGNPCVSWLVAKTHPPTGGDGASFVVQLTLGPRLRSGLWGIVEDADDIGVLTIGATGIEFLGDSVQLTVPFEQVTRVRLVNVGLRGLFVYGARVVLDVSGVPEVESLEFTERSSWLLPASWRASRRMHAAVCGKTASLIRPPRGEELAKKP